MTDRAGAVLALALGLVVSLTRCSPDEMEPRSGALGSAPTSAGASRSTSTPVAEAAPVGNDETSPPARIRFAGRIVEPLPRSIRREMRGRTWQPGCPVPLTKLALLRFNHWGFDGEVDRGPMIVHASIAEDVLGVFEALFRERFPIRAVALAKRFRPEADPDTRRSVTGGFNCRPIVTPDGPGNVFSQHAFGLAVDVNPLQNPYVRAEGFVRNRFARPYVDRSQALRGMIHDGDAVVRAFAAIGWTWGGHWTGGRDYMHFSLAGR